MKTEITEFAETDLKDFRFITEVIQRGKIKPAKYIHGIEIQYRLYEELKLQGIIKPEYYFVYETAFFEFRHERVIISFVNRGLCDSLHFAIDKFLIVDATGNYPIKRTYQSKMNNDKSIRELVVLQRTKTRKRHI